MELLLKKKFVAGLALIIISPFLGVAQIPDFSWAKKGGGTAYDQAWSIAVDGSGNSYVTGNFEGTAIFGNYSITSNGGQDIFVVKYDAAGNVLWAERAGDTDSDEGLAIAVDANGNSYVTGSFSGTIVFGNTTLTSSGDRDVVVVKYDNSGNPVWADKAGGSGADTGFGICLDSSGKFLLTGKFSGAANFGGLNLLSFGEQDIFTVMYDASGNVEYARRCGGEGVDGGYAIDAISTGNSYITGSFTQSANFGGNQLTSSGSTDVFTVKYDGAGNVDWVRKAGGADTDVGLGIGVDLSGSCYVTGYFMETASFGNTVLSSSGAQDVFIVKYNINGNVVWALKGGGSGMDSGFGITVDDNGNSYVTGSFSGTAAFGNHTLISNGYFDVFVMKLNAAGDILWIKNAGGINDDRSTGIAVNTTDNVFSTGYFDGFTTIGSTLLTSNGMADAFITQLSTINGLSENSTASIPIHPNPFITSFQLTLPTTEPATAILTDLLGREVHRQYLTPETEKAQFTISPSQNLPHGMYLLQIQQGIAIRQARVLKQ